MRRRSSTTPTARARDARCIAARAQVGGGSCAVAALAALTLLIAGAGRASADDGEAPNYASIMEIQGPGLFSPLDGETVTTRGVVTLETDRGGSFWIQDPHGDDDPDTSDGLYVYRGESAGNVNPGDYIEITATVDDWVPNAGPASQPLTELVSPRSIRVLESGRPLPTPVEITTVPDVSIPDALRFWERLEGMLIRVRDGVAVSATSRYGEFAILSPPHLVPGSGFHRSTGHLIIRRTDEGTVDYNPERIIVDDGSLGRAPIVTPGTSVPLLEGVVDYSFGNYKIQPSLIEVGEARPASASGDLNWSNRAADAPDRRGPGSADTAVIATFNVENLFDRKNNPLKDDSGSTPTPRELETKLTKLTRFIVDTLEVPAIVVVQEVENEAILQTLGDRVNSRARRGSISAEVDHRAVDYVAVSFESSDRRGIENGFLYDRSRVRLVQAYRLGGPDVAAAFGPQSPSPGREPIVGVFQIPSVLGEQDLTIVGNHFKSKGGDQPLFGVTWPPIRETEAQRRDQAKAVRRFVDEVFAENAESLLVVAGDLNDFQFPEPGEQEHHPLGILEGGRIALRNVIGDLPDAERFTYVYDGNSQVLDHILVSLALEGYLLDTTVARGNAGSPASLADEADTWLRSSDHDALLIRLRRREGVPSNTGGNQ